jgi:pimeloyl-ACP methyl ester carboxylesterase
VIGPQPQHGPSDHGSANCSASSPRGGLRLTVSGIRQGAPFIVQTRLQWLALTRQWHRFENDRRSNPPIVGIQLLGAADDLVAPDDSVDFATDLVAPGDSDDFVLIELPFAKHTDAHIMERPTPDQRRAIESGVREGNLSEICKQYNKQYKLKQKDKLELRARWLLFGRAVSQPAHLLADIRINPQHMSDRPALQPDASATHVVLVIHGIRDRGFWTQKIARAIKREAEKQNEGKDDDDREQFRSFTGSYGYFAVVPFVLPWIRRWKSEWLMDRYVEVRALYPNAAVSFVGHSNGTYLLARALTDYPAVRFTRVVLAGSVVRRDFDWLRQLNPESSDPRVTEVFNYVATRDWVVAIGAKAFQPFKFFFDLGSAGHDGFDQIKRAPHCRLHEARYVDGAHSAAITETQWDYIARFIVTGESVAAPPIDFKPRRRWWLVASGWVSPLIVLSLVWLVIGLGIALTKAIHGQGILDLELKTPVWTWSGFECPLSHLSDACSALSPVGRCLLAAMNWLVAALQGRIVTFCSRPPDGFSSVRAAICAAYWWGVYTLATRF